MVKERNNAQRQSNTKTKNVDKGKYFVLKKVPESDEKIVS